MILKRRMLLLGAGGALAAFLLYVWRVQAALLLRLVLGGGALAYLFYPLSQWFEKKFRLNRTGSILCAFGAALGTLTVSAVLFVPPLLEQMRELIASLPAFVESLRVQMRAVNTLLSERGLNRLTVPELDWDRILASLPPLLGGGASLAGSVAARFTEWALVFMLSYYFLRDRERVLLHLELLVPSALRKMALTMASAVHREIGTFLRGQMLISLMVGLLSGAALALAGVKSFLALGMIGGLFNMIPYFGPILGAVPSILIALAQGPLTALFAGIGLFVVQQLDGLIISPRIMGALTGLHPGIVLLSITLGSSFAGVAGMLLAIPATLAVRAIVRVWMMRESII